MKARVRARGKGEPMPNIFYVIGMVVVVLAVLGYLQIG